MPECLPPIGEPDHLTTDPGFSLIPNAVAAATVERLLRALERVPAEVWQRREEREGYALRNLFTHAPEVAGWVASREVRDLVEPVLGPAAFPVQSLLFDKHPEANWKVRWHQDVMIPVRARRETPGFRSWSVKAGQTYVQPPAEVLERMLILRLHLDDCPAENGALRVIPGSHAAGRLNGEAVRQWRERVPEVACALPAGGILLMRPLLLHASSPAELPRHRRVIHVEFTADPLPGDLEWPWPHP